MSKITHKKRGKRTNKIINNPSDIQVHSDETQNRSNQNIILKLRVPATKVEPASVIHNDELTRVFENDIPVDNCRSCSRLKKMLEKKQAIIDRYKQNRIVGRVNKLYTGDLTFIDVGTGDKINLKKTKVHCFWDGFQFSSLPCPLPEKYVNGEYHVRGCFCSFNCMMAYNVKWLRDSKMNERTALIIRMYRDYYGIGYEEDVTIKPAADREVLNIYGGTETIESFRLKLTIHNVDLIIYYPPLRPNIPVIEEYNLGNDNFD